MMKQTKKTWEKTTKQKISSLACVVFKNKQQQTLVEKQKKKNNKKQNTHTHNCNGYT